MKHKLINFFIILLAGCMGSFSSDVYAPSLPHLTKVFSTSIEDIQWTMTTFMLGIAVSQFLYGPLSEGYGRKVPLVIGLFVCFIGTFTCLHATNVEFLIIGRFIQGLGSGAGTTLWKAIFRDISTKEELLKYGGFFTIIVTLVIPTAPIIGGYLEDFFSWKANFLVITLYTLTTIFFVISFFKDTSKYHHKDRISFSFATSTFYQILSNKVFIGYAFIALLSYGSFFSWYAAGPILIIEKLHISPMEFGWLSFIAVASGMILSAFINGIFANRLGTAVMMRLGWGCMLFAGLLMLILKSIMGVDLYIIIGPMTLFYFGITFIWPSAFFGAFGPFGHVAGYAGSAYTLLQMGGAAIFTGIVSLFPDTTPIPLAIIFILCPLLAWVLFEKIVLPSEQKYLLEKKK